MVWCLFALEREWEQQQFTKILISRIPILELVLVLILIVKIIFLCGLNYNF